MFKRNFEESKVPISVVSCLKNLLQYCFQQHMCENKVNQFKTIINWAPKGSTKIYNHNKEADLSDRTRVYKMMFTYKHIHMYIVDT